MILHLSDRERLSFVFVRHLRHLANRAGLQTARERSSRYMRQLSATCGAGLWSVSRRSQPGLPRKHAERIQSPFRKIVLAGLGLFAGVVRET